MGRSGGRGAGARAGVFLFVEQEVLLPVVVPLSDDPVRGEPGSSSRYPGPVVRSPASSAMYPGDGESAEGGGSAGLTCCSYNQDCTSLAIGTKTGYKLFSLGSVEQLDLVHESNEMPDVYIVERLFSSSLVVVVSHTKPRQMNVYHFKKGTEICNYSYSSNILSVRLNRQRLIVCLEESIYIHNIKDMKLLKTLLEIPRNLTGLCALSINHSNSYLAYPGSCDIGEIVVYDANSLKSVCVIPAHDSLLAAFSFNSTGSKLASASEKGTVIRVFSIPEGQKLYEFRRGMKRYVNISSLVFSMDSQFLCASSNTETVHIFKLEQLADSRTDDPPTWTGYMGKMFMAATNYLPTQVSDMMNQDRAFATVRLNLSGQRNVCTLSTIQKLPRLLVASSDGHIYIYNLDPQDGGECVLIKRHSMFESKSEENKENDLGSPVPQSYAATVARPSAVPSASTVPGFSEDGGALRGEVIPEHEFATGPVCLDDENEFPPVPYCL
ncbi:WD repeat domain phosphoinositide-interacting protein 1 isoform X3 [Microcaecilia unicolor]|uniref:WD repeat domain phosphoinositide-interacting protein 1 isoform X3 n=1 Tax=Microcaecilia unicolor TaxID=1415580 RepID=A0A6P7YHC1_9AMPH|nr:WD repeat domain phosphoinositide-interacting protein 1 isoform X3 [Microcaecilia unicolor]